MGKLDGKIALITGGGTGIGRSTALLFAKEGADVAVNYSRSSTDAETTAADITALGRRGISVQADVADDASVREMVSHVTSELGSIDILVNSAGTTRFVALADVDGITEEDWSRIMGVNVKGAFSAARAVIPSMRAKGGGCIVNVASIAGLTGQGSSIVYAASKAAMISITKSLALSQAPDIRVNAVAPGLVETRWVAEQQEFLEHHRENTPMKRNATPDDVAEAIFGLVTSQFVTGQTLTVDGGRSL